MEPRPGIYRHFKGGKYLVFGVSTGTEDGKKVVVYTALYEPHCGKIDHRPLENFTENVDDAKHNYKGPRFRALESFEKLISDLNIILPEICSRETSSDPNGYTDTNPLWGHGAVVALLVQDVFGGDLLRASLEGTPFAKMRSHYWNRLPGGMVLDFTASQFGEVYPISFSQAEVRSRDYVLSNQETKTRYELLKKFYDQTQTP